MNDFTDKNRLIALERSPLDKDVLLLTAFTGQEEISRLFNYQLEMLSVRDDIGPVDVVGKPVTVRINYGDEQIRYFDGYISRFLASGLTIQGMRLYRAEMVPWFWFLTCASDCRIFQDKTVPDIVKELFSDFGFNGFETKEIKGKHPKLGYSVQYRESAFNFIARLLEQEGIFYWFRHEKDKHVLVLADHKGAYAELAEKEVEYASGGETPLVQSHIHSWEHEYAFFSGRWTQTDYNFETPSTSLQASTPTALKLPDTKKYELYDYPGEYWNRDEGEGFIAIRMEEEEATYDMVNAASNCRSFNPGGKFTLTHHDFADEKKAYLVTSITHTATEETYVPGEGASGEYSNSFICIPASVTFRPARTTPKPVIQGPQTAVVVGPSGEEIFTDKYGRVKVQFHWDRRGKRNEKSSCWVRVSYGWAGQNWGAVTIPRIKQEVIVEFLDGDPDRPIITGRVYNAEQMPPYELPANKTQSGVKSRSSLGGSGANYNEVRFEDKKGSEQLLIHAEKNQDIEVENDETHWVGHDRTKTIDHDETSHIKHDRTETVDHNETITIGNDRKEKVVHNETITIGDNRTEQVGKNEKITIGDNRTEKVGKNESITIGDNRTEKVGKNESITIGDNRTEKVGKDESINIGANRTEQVAKNESVKVGDNQTLNIGKNRNEQVGKNESVSVGDNRTHSVGKNDSLSVKNNLSINAGDQISIVTGKASILMKKDGTITIKGKDITINGSGEINVKASKNITMKGQKILQN